MPTNFQFFFHFLFFYISAIFRIIFFSRNNVQILKPFPGCLLLCFQSTWEIDDFKFSNAFCRKHLTYENSEEEKKMKKKKKSRKRDSFAFIYHFEHQDGVIFLHFFLSFSLNFANCECFIIHYGESYPISTAIQKQI